MNSGSSMTLKMVGWRVFSKEWSKDSLLHSFAETENETRKY